MSQELRLDRIGCARNAGVFILIRISLGTLIFLALNAVYYIPTDLMLGAVPIVKANIILFLGVIVALFFMSLISLIIGFPLNNALESVDNEQMSRAKILRVVEVFIFVAGMVLLFTENPFFLTVMLLGLIVFGLHLMIVGYVVFKSGFLNRFLGILLIVGGSVGYLFKGIVPTFALVSSVGIMIAILSEVILAISLIITALRTVPDLSDSRARVIRILTELGEATTVEIIEEASKEASECKDRVPNMLTSLESEGIVEKRFSKEKKGYVWTLIG